MSINSSVGFRSNVYPVKGEDCLRDREFLSVIHDPEALTVFKRLSTGYSLTSIQKEEQQAAVHCMHAEPGEYPWGTVLVDGRMTYVCRCEHYRCPYIKNCRPGFELPVDACDEPTENLEETQGVRSEEEACLELESPRETTEPAQPAIREDEQADNGSAPINTPLGNVLEDSVLPVEDDFADISRGGASSNDGPDILIAIEENRDEEQELPSSDNLDAVPGKRYDRTQQEIVESGPDRRVYVNAGPGTGKTFTLIERLKYLISHGVPGDEILVLSYTRAAVAVMKERLKAAATSGEIDAEWQAIDITTFDKFCTRLLYFIKSEENPQLKIAGMDYDQRILEAKLILQRNKDLLSGVSHFVVDETQDLVGPRADLVLEALRSLPDGCGFTLLGDRCQSLYDYQTKDRPSLTTSERFYDLVVGEHHPDEIGLTHNYRQKGSLSLDLTPIRKAILGRDVDAAAAEAEAAVGDLPQPQVMIRDLHQVLPDGGKKLGILTRTNAQALETSSLLWRMGVQHELSRSTSDRCFTRAIADALMGYPNETIDAASFGSRLRPMDDVVSQRIWGELRKIEGVHPEGSRLRVEEVLQAIAATMPSPDLSAVKADRPRVFVGTVHSAKGREFDKVWLLAEDFSTDSFAGDLDECKVAYVGLSRAIDEVVLQCLDGHYLTGGKKASRSRQRKERYFKKYVPRRKIVGRGAGGRITNMEILNGEDIDFKSQASSRELQEFISDYLKEGAALRLVRETNGNGLAPTYKIVLDDQTGKVLGRMQMTFAEAYAKEANSQKYPDAFDEVYVDAIITCTGRASGAPSGATKFGTAAVWHGFTIGGFAHRDDPQGY